MTEHLPAANYLSHTSFQEVTISCTSSKLDNKPRKRKTGSRSPTQEREKRNLKKNNREKAKKEKTVQNDGGSQKTFHELYTYIYTHI